MLLAPSEAKYAKGQGVVLLRAKRYTEAEACFIDALKLQKDFNSAIVNLMEVRRILQYLQEEDVKQRRRMEHTLRSPLQYSMTDLFSDDSEYTAKLLSVPFVIRGASLGRDRAQQFSTAQLKRHFGRARVDYYPYSMTHSKISPFFLSLAESLDFLSNPSKLSAQSAGFMVSNDAETRQMRKNVTGQYAQWNLDAESWEHLLRASAFTVPPVLDDRYMHWSTASHVYISQLMSCLFWLHVLTELD